MIRLVVASVRLLNVCRKGRSLPDKRSTSVRRTVPERDSGTPRNRRASGVKIGRGAPGALARPVRGRRCSRRRRITSRLRLRVACAPTNARSRSPPSCPARARRAEDPWTFGRGRRRLPRRIASPRHRRSRPGTRRPGTDSHPDPSAPRRGRARRRPASGYRHRGSGRSHRSKNDGHNQRIAGRERGET